MLRTVTLAVVLTALAALAVAVGAAHAQSGLNLSWDNCGTAGAADKSFACATTQGDFRLYGSFAAPPGIERCAGYLFEVYVFYVGDPLPPWWDVGPGGCRKADWSVTTDWPGETCVPFLEGPVLVTRSVTQSGPYLHLRGEVALLSAQAVPSGTELYAFTMIFRNSEVNTCEGCCDPVCLQFGLLQLYQESPLPTVTLDNPLDSFWVNWQGGACGVPGTQAVSAVSTGCLPTPVKRQTWGSIKALYR